MCSPGKPTEPNTASDTRFPGSAQSSATSLGAPILDQQTEAPGSRSDRTVQTILRLRRQSPDATCLVPSGVRRASQPVQFGQQRNHPKFTNRPDVVSPRIHKIPLHQDGSQRTSRLPRSVPVCAFASLVVRLRLRCPATEWTNQCCARVPGFPAPCEHRRRVERKSARTCRDLRIKPAAT